MLLYYAKLSSAELDCIAARVDQQAMSIFRPRSSWSAVLLSLSCCAPANATDRLRLGFDGEPSELVSYAEARAAGTPHECRFFEPGFFGTETPTKSIVVGESFHSVEANDSLVSHDPVWDTEFSSLTEAWRTHTLRLGPQVYQWDRRHSGGLSVRIEAVEEVRPSSPDSSAVWHFFMGEPPQDARCAPTAQEVAPVPTGIRFEDRTAEAVLMFWALEPHDALSAEARTRYLEALPEIYLPDHPSLDDGTLSAEFGAERALNLSYAGTKWGLVIQETPAAKSRHRSRCVEAEDGCVVLEPLRGGKRVHRRATQNPMCYEFVIADTFIALCYHNYSGLLPREVESMIDAFVAVPKSDARLTGALAR